MDLPQWNIPVARLPTIVTTQISGHLPFPVPVEPISSSNGNLLSTDTLPSSEVLNAVAAALENTDISYVRPRQNNVRLHAQPGSVEYAILQCNQHAFAYAARSAPSARHVPGTTAAGQHQAQQQHPQQPAAAAPTKQARQLQAKDAEVPAPKRRKWAAIIDEEFVSRSMSVQQVKDDVAAAVSSFLAKAESLHARRDDSGDDADDSDREEQQQPQTSAAAAAAGHAQKISKPFLPLDLLKELQVHLSHGKQAGVLGQVDEEQLRQLLKMLLGHVQLGDGKLLDEEDMASSVAGKAIAASLEAACCCLQLLAAAGLPNSLYLDELLTAAVQVAKYQLQFNVLAFLHPPYRQLYRPSAITPDDGQATAGKKRARLESAGRVPHVANDVRAKLELLLSLLAQVVDRVLLEVELLLPLVRVALTCLQVDSLQLLQAQAIALTVAVFRAYPQQRPAIMDEVLTTVIANLAVVGSRGPVRLFETTDAAVRPLPMMMATALVMQLVEASVQLPAVDADINSIKTAFQGAYGCSDVFWKGVFARLPAAKAAKSDGAADFKLVVEALLTDLLSVQMLPEWPAATILLRRFLKVLYSDKGLKHSDTAVKLAAVEFTGQLTARLCAEALAAEQTADEVQALLEAAGAAADVSLLEEAPARRSEQLIYHLLLDYLSAAVQGSGSSSTESSSSITAVARRFMCCRMLNDTVYLSKRLSGGAEATKEELSTLLVQHRQLQDSAVSGLGPDVANLALSRAQHVSLLRWWVVQGPLGAGRATLIRWLVEAGSRDGKDPNPATVRTKVFKCLGSVVESDSRVLALPEVSAAVRAALEDDSNAVREASLELLAKLIHSNPPLAGEYFDVLVQASHDAGVSVRKRAIRSLWDCCNCPGFTRATEAVVTVLQRALDPEESMRSLVMKFCGDMWFLEGSTFAGLSEVPGSSANVARTADVRARELADVAMKAYEAGGKAIHVPLAQDYPLVVILKEVLGMSSSAAAAGAAAAARELGALRAGAEEVALALLNMVLQQQDHEDDGVSTSSNAAGSFPYLLALHALCCADASLAAPEADPQRFVRCLAPYVSRAGVQQDILSRTNSTSSGSNPPVEDTARRNAEECLCLLSVLESLLRHLGAVEQDTMKQLMADLLALISKQRYLQVVAAGCQVLCTLAPLYPPVSSSISQLVTKCYNIAEGALRQQQGPTVASPALVQNAPKVLYILGQLCRHGPAVIDAAAEADSSRKNCTECMELCVALWQRSDPPGNAVLQRSKDAALQAMGMLVTGKPQLMLQPLQLQMPNEQAPSAAAATRVSDRGSPDNGDSIATASTGVEGQQQQPDSGRAVTGVPRCAAEVYHAALTTGSVSVKSRVLTNLVELLRSEEASLVSRQKDSEAANSSSRLASTKPSEAKAPLAKVNGAADAAADSSSSSIVQRVWEDVLRLATGVSTGVGSSQLGTPAGAAAAAAVAAGDAAQMRRKALELIEAVLRGGLVAPWSAVAPLVALLTDEAVDTRQAALKALRSAAEKYTEYVLNQLAPGVSEAFNFQSRLWNAKHPGQPLPKSPGPGVLEGLAAMYQHIVAPAPSSRSKFLLNLLKPFATACSLAEPAAAAREDAHKLAFIAFVAASLPFKKADEPLVLVHSINSHISRQAQGALDILTGQLIKLGLAHRLGLEEHDQELETAAVNGADAAGTEQQQEDQQQQQQPCQDRALQQNGLNGMQPLQLPLKQELLAALKASLALSMLLVLKQYLMAAYSLIDERVAAFKLKGEKYRAEQKALVGKAKQVGDFSLQRIDLKSQADATGDLLVEQYKVFKGLLECDAANYKEAAVLADLEDGDDGEAGLDASHVGATPAVAAATAKAAGTAATGLVLYSMDNKKLARIKSSGKGASTAGKAGSTAGKRGKPRGSTTGKGTGKGGSTKGKGRKRRRQDDSEGSDDEDWGDGPVPSKELF